MLGLNFYLSPEFIQNASLGVASLIGIIWVLNTPWEPKP
jgi:hypothetical protein